MILNTKYMYKKKHMIYGIWSHDVLGTWLQVTASGIFSLRLEPCDRKSNNKFKAEKFAITS